MATGPSYYKSTVVVVSCVDKLASWRMRVQQHPSFWSLRHLVVRQLGGKLGSGQNFATEMCLFGPWVLC